MKPGRADQTSKPRGWVTLRLSVLLGIVLLVAVMLVARQEYNRRAIDASACERLASEIGHEVPDWILQLQKRGIYLREAVRSRFSFVNWLCFDGLSAEQCAQIRLPAGLIDVQFSDCALDDETLKLCLRDVNSLESITLVNTLVTDASIHELATTQPLKSLRVRGAPITDQALTSLGHAKQLESLLLAAIQSTDPTFSTADKMHITDDGIRALRGLPLTSLTLVDTAITDQCGPIIETFMSLKSLEVWGNATLTDDFTKHLAGLVHLSHICLDSPNITDRSMKALSGLPELDELDVANTAITDAGVAYFANSRMYALDVSNTKITDESMRVLSQLPELRVLYAANTAITDAAVAHPPGGRARVKQRLSRGPFGYSFRNLP